MHRKRQMAAGFGGSEFVFTNQHGGPLRAVISTLRASGRS